MFKSTLKYIIHLTNQILSPIYKLTYTINNIRQYIYSDKYCQLFNCDTCNFLRPINSIKGPQYFRIGNNTVFGKMAVLTAWDEYGKQTFSPSVTIGKNCNFGDFLHITCINKITIGEGVLTGRWVTITDNSHGQTSYESLQPPPQQRPLYSKGPVKIGDNVWIGDKATILPGVTIGNGCIIGANTIVTKDIPPFSIVTNNSPRFRQFS